MRKVKTIHFPPEYDYALKVEKEDDGLLVEKVSLHGKDHARLELDIFAAIELTRAIEEILGRRS